MWATLLAARQPEGKHDQEFALGGLESTILTQGLDPSTSSHGGKTFLL